MSWGELIGKITDRVSEHRNRQWSERNMRREYRNQKEFAMWAPYWDTWGKMQAAEHFKIHPLAMLGQQAQGYHPQQVGSPPRGTGSGAGIGRAIDNLRGQRVAEEDRKIENDYKKAETKLLDARTKAITNSINTAGKPKAAGGGQIENHPDVQESTNKKIVLEPVKIKKSAGDPAYEAGGKSGQTFTRMKLGRIKIAKTQELGEIMESQGLMDDTTDFLSDSKAFLTLMFDEKKREKLRRIATIELRKSKKLAHDEILVWHKSDQSFYATKRKTTGGGGW